MTTKYGKPMKKSKLLLIPIVLSSLALAGCASGSKKVVDLNLNYVTAHSVPAGSFDRNAQTQVAEAATSVGHSLQNLSAIQMAAHPHARVPKPYNARRLGLNQASSISWTGPIGPLVKRIARAGHYRFQSIGSRPAIPVIVSLNARNQTLASILQNVRLQAQGKANIGIYPRQRLIQLSYYR